RHLDQRAVGIRVDHRVQQDSALVEVAFSDRFDSLSKEFLIATGPFCLFKSYFCLLLAAAGCKRKRKSQYRDNYLNCFHATWAAAPNRHTAFSFLLLGWLIYC